MAAHVRRRCHHPTLPSNGQLWILHDREFLFRFARPDFRQSPFFFTVVDCQEKNGTDWTYTTYWTYSSHRPE